MRIRLYESPDRDQVIALSARLSHGVAPWRDPQAVSTATRTWVITAVDHHDPEHHPVYVAEDDDGAIAGFVSVGSQPHWSGEIDAYVGELAVAERMARRGVGKALMDAAEDWGRRHGHRRLTLETGAANPEARAFYRSRGYQEEDVRLSKPLTDD